MAAPTTLVQQFAKNPGWPQLPVFNNSTTTAIAAFVAVKIDSGDLIADANPTNASIAVVAAASDGDVCIGVTTEAIAASGGGNVAYGSIVPLGSTVPMTADGAITAGTYVMASGGSSKKGFAKAITSATSSIGIALTTAADGEPVLVMLVGGKNA
jgi:hypothetical protein